MAGKSLNLNALTNGTRLGVRVARLTVGELPATMRRHTACARRYRKELEAIVAEVKGQVDLADAHLIDEACGAEIHAAICRWLLREKLDRMSPSDIFNCSQQILKSKGIRNRAFGKLRLEESQVDPLTILYGDTESLPGDPEEPTDGAHSSLSDADEDGAATPDTPSETNAGDSQSRTPEQSNVAP